MPIDRRRLVLAVPALAFAGCQPVQRTRVPMPQPEVPPMNLPRPLREWNWGGGSCVHASTVMVFRWQGHAELAAWWRKRYSGGETSYGLRKKLDAASVPYVFTETGDESVLEYASDTRRGAVIFFYPAHSICFAGYSRRQERDEAVLLDNNRIDQFIFVPKTQFVKEWKNYGGFALTPTYGPAPARPYYPWTT